MNRNYSARALPLVIAAAIAFGGCKDKAAEGGATGGGGTTSASASEIVIGEYASMTGGTATFGIQTHKGMMLAIKEANAAGGIGGKQIKLVTEDDQSKAEQVGPAVTKLLDQDKAIGILGEVASTRSMMAAPICENKKVPMISPSSTNPKVTTLGQYIFRVCFTDDLQATVAAKFAYDQGFRNVAAFTDKKSDYSVGFTNIFKEQFTKLGGKIAGEQSYQEGDQDFKAQLSSIKALNPDAILCPGYYTEMGTIARQAKEVGLAVPIVGGDGWDSPELVKGAGNTLEGCFFTDHYFSTELKEPSVQQFIADYEKEYGGEVPGSLCALGYDAAKVMLKAMQEVVKSGKTLDSTAIRDEIAKIKDYEGATGKITIDANRNARKSVLVLQIKGDKFVVHKSYTPEEVGQ